MVTVLLMTITLFLLVIMSFLGAAIGLIESEPVQAGWRLLELWLRLQIYGSEREQQVAEIRVEIAHNAAVARLQLDQELAMIDLLERLAVLEQASHV